MTSIPCRQNPRKQFPVVRFRLRKLVPFDVDDASTSYQVIHQTAEESRLLVTAIPNAVLAEYEEAVRLAGYEPGVVLPSTLASLAGLTPSEPALLVNLNGNSVTTAITRGDELLLHRSIELPPSKRCATTSFATLSPSRLRILKTRSHPFRMRSFMQVQAAPRS